MMKHVGMRIVVGYHEPNAEIHEMYASIYTIYRKITEHFLKKNENVHARDEALRLLHQKTGLTYQRSGGGGRLRYVEAHLTEHCNLNCRHCGHFSPLADEEYTNVADFEKDFQRLSDLTEKDIERIRLMGGEPLLHPECEKFFIIARKYFPKSHISLVTNGILLMSRRASFWDTLSGNNIIIEYTKYPVQVDYEAIADTAKSKNVACRQTDNAEGFKTLNFYPLDLRGNQNAANNFLHCSHAANCIFLSNGKLSICPIIPTMRHFNKYFGVAVPVEDSNQIDIYQAENLDRILMFLSRPAPMCGYCNIDKRQWNLPWRPSRKDINEWSQE